MEGFFPYINKPVRNILAPSQAINMMVRAESMMESSIWENGGTAMLILMNISVGEKRGNNDARITAVEFGFWVTMIPSMNGMMRR